MLGEEVSEVEVLEVEVLGVVVLGVEVLGVVVLGVLVWGLVSVWGVSMGRVCERKLDTEQNLEHSPPFPMRLVPWQTRAATFVWCSHMM